MSPPFLDQHLGIPISWRWAPGGGGLVFSRPLLSAIVSDWAERRELSRFHYWGIVKGVKPPRLQGNIQTYLGEVVLVHGVLGLRSFSTTL